MCRQLAVVDTHSLTMKELGVIVGKCNDLWAPTQKDGFGYVSVWSDLSVNGERFLEPYAFRAPGAVTLAVQDGTLSRRLRPRRAWNQIGSGFPRPGGPLLVHARNATSKRELESVHPFEKKGWFLTHNGVVEPMTYQKTRETKTSCDSEHIINAFAYGSGFLELEDMEGWAACFLLTPRTRRLRAFRCDTAPLFISWMGREHGTYILASDGDHIEKVAKAIKRAVTSPIPVDINTALSFLGPGPENFVVRKWEGLRERIRYTTTTTVGGVSATATSSSYHTAFGSGSYVAPSSPASRPVQQSLPLPPVAGAGTGAEPTPSQSTSASASTNNASAVNPVVNNPTSEYIYE